MMPDELDRRLNLCRNYLETFGSNVRQGQTLSAEHVAFICAGIIACIDAIREFENRSP